SWMSPYREGTVVRRFASSGPTRKSELVEHHVALDDASGRAVEVDPAAPVDVDVHTRGDRARSGVDHLEAGRLLLSVAAQGDLGVADDGDVAVPEVDDFGVQPGAGGFRHRGRRDCRTGFDRVLARRVARAAGRVTAAALQPVHIQARAVEAERADVDAERVYVERAITGEREAVPDRDRDADAEHVDRRRSGREAGGASGLIAGCDTGGSYGAVGRERSGVRGLGGVERDQVVMHDFEIRVRGRRRRDGPALVVLADQPPKARAGAGAVAFDVDVDAAGDVAVRAVEQLQPDRFPLRLIRERDLPDLPEHHVSVAGLDDAAARSTEGPHRLGLTADDAGERSIVHAHRVGEARECEKAGYHDRCAGDGARP